MGRGALLVGEGDLARVGLDALDLAHLLDVAEVHTLLRDQQYADADVVVALALDRAVEQPGVRCWLALFGAQLGVTQRGGDSPHDATLVAVVGDSGCVALAVLGLVAANRGQRTEPPPLELALELAVLSAPGA